MMNALLNVLTYAAIPAAVVVIGGIVGAVRTPGAAARSAVQHFAAGVVFAALATELLPDVMHRALTLVTIIGFSLGVAVMLGLKMLTQAPDQNALEGQEPKRQPRSLILTLAVDFTLDGLLIGVGFAAGAKQGVLLTIALALEALFLGVSGATALSGASASRTRVILTTVGFAALLLGGASAGTVLLSGVSGALLDAVLSFGVAALLYLVTEELLVEAHETPETPLLSTMFFLGFLVLLVIEMHV